MGRLLTVMELEALTGVSRHTWRRHIRDGSISAIRIGRLVRVAEETLEAFLAKHTLPAKQQAAS